jgi:predicted enzyme related to lactoylglutathione lyase
VARSVRIVERLSLAFSGRGCGSEFGVGHGFASDTPCNVDRVNHVDPNAFLRLFATGKLVNDVCGLNDVALLDLSGSKRGVDSMATPFSVWQPEGLTGVETDRCARSWVTSHLVTDDPDRTKSFYQSVFGWAEHDGQFRQGEYVASVGTRDITALTAPNWLTVFATNDLESTLATVTSSGGHATGRSVMGNQAITVVADNQGTPFGITTTPTNSIRTRQAS